jgi:N-acyl-D-glutamate deacylase
MPGKQLPKLFRQHRWAEASGSVQTLQDNKGGRALMKNTILAFTLLMAGMSQLAAALEHDLVILGGRVIDPETGYDQVSNVAIDKGSITLITDEPVLGRESIDASDHIVSPGFIDLHMHGVSLSGYRMQAAQGVTTALELESGVLPVSEWYAAQKEKNLPINYGAASGWTFARIATFTGLAPEPTAGYFQRAQGLSGWKENTATPTQLQSILDMVEQGLEEGALGIGVNAGYAPGYGHKEYFELARLAKRYDVATYTHARYMSVLEPRSTFEALQELIANAALVGARMHICHINSNSLRDIDATIDLLERAREQSFHVTAGAYPWSAMSTVINAAMFNGPDWRERVGYTPNSFQLGGQRLSDEQVEAIKAKAPGTIIVYHFLDDRDPADIAVMDRSILHPDVLVESDTLPWFLIEGKSVSLYEGEAWPLPANVFSHPRSAGTFAKILQQYVRERKLMSYPEAIRKMSLMPAQTLESFVPQMKKKGRLQVGMDADILVFDPATVANRATYTQPAKAAVGFQTVIVNGVPVLKGGELIPGAAPGRAIRRPH